MGRSTWLQLTFVVLLQIGYIASQSCTQTKPSTTRSARCPLFTSEAFTVERLLSNGSSLYVKTCCDRRTVEMGKATAKGCQTTMCLTPSNPDYEFPCSSMNKVIVDGEYMVFEESMRDTCLDKNTTEEGIAAVCCPPNSFANLLVSAYGAEPNEFPHQARLRSGNVVCGGTVYNKDWVITAGHCVVDHKGNPKKANGTEVTLGTNIASLSSETNVFPIKKIVIHEGFSLLRGSQESLRLILGKRIYNDIALLQLERSIDFDNEPHIRALPIAPPKFQPEKYAKQVVIVGWGTTDLGILSQHLQKANLLIRKDESCFKTLLGGFPYPDTKEFSNQLLCIGGIMNGQYSPVAGKGDSGGPAICRGPDGFAVHCGVTSFGGDGDACRKNLDEGSCKPSAYVEVSHFRDWIIKHAGEQGEEGLLKAKLYGDDVPEGMYEHQVHITSKKGPSCGGTLVSKDVVVTAGHCAFTDARKVRYGLQIKTYDGKTYEPVPEGVTGSKAYMRYVALDKLNRRKSGGKSFLNSPYNDDIAVIKLNKSVEIPEENLAKLPGSKVAPDMGTNAVELSVPLGSTSNNSNSTTERKLMQRDFRILDAKDCQRRLDRYKVMGVEARFNVKKTFCGVEKYSGGGICDRELGGGLICEGEEEGADILCGIQTFRLCDMSMPSAFLNVGKYEDMIRASMMR